MFHSLMVLCVSFVVLAVAHEHHGDAIPDGEAISADPIVRLVIKSPNSTVKYCE